MWVDFNYEKWKASVECFNFSGNYCTMHRLKTCCGCCDLKTGTLIVGICGIVSIYLVFFSNSCLNID